MKTTMIGAGSDMGVQVDGAKWGPTTLFEKIKEDYSGKMISLFIDDKVKSKAKDDFSKNLETVNAFNKEIYQTVIEAMEHKEFPLILGGDHSIAIGSVLADCRINQKIGIIWIDAHTDYNTFETTKTGNLHGLPLAAITGYHCEELRKFHEGPFISPENTVVVGARSIDPWEMPNVKDSGITVFTTEDIKKQGAETIMKQAFQIATNNTVGVHVSYDLDFIDPEVAPGVSVPEVDGINELEALEILEEVKKHWDSLTAFELVELNPLTDKDGKTERLAIKILKEVLEKTEEIAVR